MFDTTLFIAGSMTGTREYIGNCDLVRQIQAVRKIAPKFETAERIDSYYFLTFRTDEGWSVDLMIQTSK